VCLPDGTVRRAELELEGLFGFRAAVPEDAPRRGYAPAAMDVRYVVRTEPKGLAKPKPLPVTVISIAEAENSGGHAIFAVVQAARPNREQRPMDKKKVQKTRTYGIDIRLILSLWILVSGVRSSFSGRKTRGRLKKRA